MDTTIRFKQALFTAGVIALLAIAYAAIVYVGVYDRSIQPGSFRSFAVTGTGKAVAVPDVASFNASVINEGGKDLGALQKSNTDKMNKLVGFLNQQGIDKKDIQTSGYQISPRYQSFGCQNGACPPSEIVGYTITQTASVKIRDFSKAGTILAGVVSAGANSVSQLNFTVDDPALVQAQARGKAIAEAKAQAEAMAEAGGFKVGKLLSIDEAGPINYAPMLKYGMGGADMAVASIAPAPAVEPGSQDFTVQVSLRYEIE